jgi:hypothetical protein
LARDRQNLPVVAARVQRQLEDSVDLSANLTVGDRSTEGIIAFVGAADPGDDFTDALGIGNPRRVLFPETFVVVLVAVQHEVNAGGVHVVPQCRLATVAAVDSSG